MANTAEDLGGVILTFIGTEMQQPAIKTEVLAFVDPGIVGAGNQLKAAVNAGL